MINYRFLDLAWRRFVQQAHHLQSACFVCASHLIDGERNARPRETAQALRPILRLVLLVMTSSLGFAGTGYGRCEPGLDTICWGRTLAWLVHARLHHAIRCLMRSATTISADRRAILPQVQDTGETRYAHLPYTPRALRRCLNKVSRDPGADRACGAATAAGCANVASDHMDVSCA